MPSLFQVTQYSALNMMIFSLALLWCPSVFSSFLFHSFLSSPYAQRRMGFHSKQTEYKKIWLEKTSEYSSYYFIFQVALNNVEKQISILKFFWQEPKDEYNDSNCARTPPLIKQQSTDNKLGLMLG